ncbi:L-rhamnose-binding lectin CSL1-like [Brachyhypopomus gauderio]|uniref:L-rhamnose-binding lectin CSL1-like n=1 Tax=Brachyhypopomus gauderio TaxID=698409 RepID=UPI0040429C10
MFSFKLFVRTLQLLAVSVFLASADISLTCQNEKTEISCGAGQIIITGVKYGRTDSSTCSVQKDPSQLSNTSCNTCSPYPTVFASCQGQSSCLVQASSSSDPCSDTYKYLNVSYYCVCSGTQTSATCESQQSELTCGKCESF